MDRKKILDQFKDQKIQNYSYNIFFFLIFAFFVGFAIRPNLMTAFNLQKELQDLKLKSQEYEAEIQQIVDYQTKVEQYRDQFYLLDEAVPKTPAIAKVLEDIRQSATDSGVILTSIAVEEVSIKTEEKQNSLKSFGVNIIVESEIAMLQNFLNTLLNQRRIKIIDDISVTKVQLEEGISNRFTITMIVKGVYL